MNIKVKQEFIKLSSADRIQINLRCLVFRGHQEDKMYLWQALTLNVSLNPLQAIRVLLLPDALVHLKTHKNTSSEVSGSEPKVTWAGGRQSESEPS